LKGIDARVFPVGRLDYDAEGALLFTNDGELANRLMHPKFKVTRTYLVKVKGVPTEASLEKLVTGVRLEDGPARAVRTRVFEKAEKNTWIELVVSEGRPHLVKRMCAAIGHPVVRLFRPAHAGIQLSGLRPGQMRKLSSQEIAALKGIGEGNAAPEVALHLPARRHGHGPEELSARPPKKAPWEGPRGDDEARGAPGRFQRADRDAEIDRRTRAEAPEDDGGGAAEGRAGRGPGAKERGRFEAREGTSRPGGRGGRFGQPERAGERSDTAGERSGRFDKPAGAPRAGERSGRFDEPAGVKRASDRSGRSDKPEGAPRSGERSDRSDGRSGAQRSAERSGRFDKSAGPSRGGERSGRFDKSAGPSRGGERSGPSEGAARAGKGGTPVPAAGDPAYAPGRGTGFRPKPPKGERPSAGEAAEPGGETQGLDFRAGRRPEARKSGGKKGAPDVRPFGARGPKR
jgi:23S rRNA pseudouridine2605 synthase